MSIIPTEKTHVPAIEACEAVANYVGINWKVLPVHGIVDGLCTCGQPHVDTKAVGKHPAISDWQRESSAEPSVVLWWTADPESNIGVMCKNSGFFVIDFDPRNAGIDAYEKFEEMVSGNLPATVEAVTGQYVVAGRTVRGRHLFYKCEDGETLVGNLAKSGLPGIDIKHNGYVLVAPSRHASGVDYEWVPGHAPWEIDVAEASDEVMCVVRKGLPGGRSAGDTSGGPLQMPTEEWTALSDEYFHSTPYGKAALKGEAEAVLHAVEGTRNNTLNDAAVKMGSLVAGRQICFADARDELQKVAGAVFGPGSEDEIDNVLRRFGGGFQAGAAIPRFPLGDLADDIDPPGTEPVGTSTESDAAFLGRLGVINWVELWADETVERWLVPGIICCGRGHSLYGDAGVGKSLLMREIAACLAAGRPVLGFAAQAPIRVVYIDHENLPRGDIRASLIDMGFGPADLERLIYLSFPEMAPLDSGSGGKEFARTIELLNPELVVLDTFGRVVEGPENDNDTWNRFYNYAGKYLKSTGIAYVRLDHVGKDPRAGMRGGSAKKGDVDLVWYLKERTKHTQFRIINQKSRTPIPEQEYTITRETGPLRHLVAGARLDWTVLLASASAFECTVRMLEDYYDTECTGVIVGQKATWEALRDRAQAEGYSRELIFEARDFIHESRAS